MMEAFRSKQRVRLELGGSQVAWSVHCVLSCGRELVSEALRTPYPGPCLCLALPRVRRPGAHSSSALAGLSDLASEHLNAGELF